MIEQSELASHHKYTLNLHVKLGQQPRHWLFLTLENEKRSCVTQSYSLRGGCRAGSQTHLPGSAANAEGDSRSRLPSIVQTSMKQDKRPRLLQRVWQTCADSGGTLHQEGKERQHILTCTVTEALSYVPTTGTACYLCLTPLPQALRPLASSILMVHSNVLCLMSRAKNAQHSNASLLPRDTGRRESEAEVSYGRLWNTHRTYQRMPVICTGK